MLRNTLEAIELLDDSAINGEKVISLFESFQYVSATTVKVEGELGSTDFIKIVVQGANGKVDGGDAPTLGIIGRLGGIGARPNRIGMVSDADGAVAVVATALKLARMSEKGDRLNGDVIITTHICPHAPTIPHEPVDFMGSPVKMAVMNEYEVLPEMDAILSIDTTKGNRIVNHKGIAISPTIKEGYILRISEDLLNVMETTTGIPAVTIPVTQQDITPYENGLFHINSIFQPCTATTAPVVGVAITTESIVPGCGTGASHEVDIAQAVRFSIEVAKEYTQQKLSFYNQEEYTKLQSLYGTMKIFQTEGNK